MTDPLPARPTPGRRSAPGRPRDPRRASPAAAPLRLDWASPRRTADRQIGYEIEAAPTPDFADRVSGHRPRRRTPAAGRARARRPAAQPRGAAPAGPGRPPSAGWSGWSEPATVEAGLLDAGGLAGGRGHAAGRPRRAAAVAGAAAAHGVRAAGGARPGPPARHLARRARGAPQRRPGRRPPAGPGLDRLPAPAARHQPRRHRPARRGRRTCSPAASATAGTAAGSVGTRRRTAAGTAVRSRCWPSWRSSCADGSASRSRTDETWRASTGEVRSADLYDGCVDRPAAAPAPAGTARASTTRGWAPAAVVPLDPAILQPRVGAAGPGRADLPPRALGAARRRDPARRRPERRRVVRLTRPRPAPATP